MQRLWIIIPIAAGLVLIAYFAYGPLIDLLRPCDAIFQQAGPRIEAKLQFIKTTGTLVIGPERIQKLAESAQLVGVRLKACCVMQKSAHMTADQLQTCIDGAKTYEARIVQVANLVGEAETARDQGNAQLANERATQARRATDIASAAEPRSPQSPQPTEPVARDEKATILPLKATILPLKATIVPAGTPG